jgi:hypothetical protein
MPGVEDVDVSAVVGRHTDYARKMARLLVVVGAERG